MSDQSGAISDLEELFLAREFGLPSGRHLRAVEEDLGEAPEPRELEAVFRSRDFGRPVALELLEGGDEPAPNVVEFPFAGPGAKPLEGAVRQRAVAALSGVAAAALVIAGLASAGGHAGRADVSALAHQSTPHASSPAVGPSAGNAVAAVTTPGGGAPVAGVTTADVGGATSPGGASAAPSVAFASQPVAVASGGSGPAPGGTPAPGGGGTSLAPVTSMVGTAVSTAGSSISVASGTVGTAVPTAPTVAGTMSQSANDVSVLGQSLITIPAG
jgi:hypothetical protein